MQKALVWVRRDLRLTDHAPLAHAASLSDTVAVAFVFDRKILADLSRTDRRLTFIHQSLEGLDTELRKRGSQLIVRIGDPVEEIPKLAKELSATLVCAGRDYETYAKKRDSKVAEALKKQGARLELLKDQVIFEGREVLSKTGTPLQGIHSLQKCLACRP
jgi:deoxyribodipyrimidine photo-lyase